MEVKSFLISVVLFSLVLIVGVNFITDVNVNYGVELDNSSFNNSYQRVDEMYNLSQDIKDDTLGAELDSDATAESMVRGSYSAIRLVKSSFGLVGFAINDIAQVLGIPTFFIQFAMTALTISIIFAIIYLVMRYRE